MGVEIDNSLHSINILHSFPFYFMQAYGHQNLSNAGFGSDIIPIVKNDNLQG